MSDIIGISMETYMRDFIPTLENFCSKSPLQPKIDYVLETGAVHVTSRYAPEFNYSFVVDPLTDKKQQIRNLKKEMEKFYPVLFDNRKISFSPEEIEELIAEGVPVKEAVQMRKDVSLPRYRIIRVHNQYNEIDMVDFKTKKVIKVKTLIPVMVVLNKLYTIKPENRFTHDFKRDTRFVHVISSKE